MLYLLIHILKNSTINSRKPINCWGSMVSVKSKLRDYYKNKKSVNHGFFVVIFFAFFSLLTGCKDAIPEMTDEQEKLITEYAANLLLKYDKVYEQGVLTDDDLSEESERLEKIADIKSQVLIQKEIKEAEKKEKEEKKNKEENSETTKKVSADIDSFLGIDGIDINYLGMTICSQYPEDTQTNDWQGITRASGNNKLVVLSFEISNNTGSEYYLDMAEHKAKYVVNFNEKLNKTPITTMLINDFIYYKGTLQPGEKINNVIIAQVSSEEAESITSVKIKMKYNENTAECFLQ